MKPIIPFALLGALLAVGAVNAAETTPVGYETLSLAPGFNYTGLRLQQPVVHAGTFETITANSVTDTGATFALTATKTYIIEINNGSGILTDVLGSAVSGSTINTTDNLLAAGVANGASYSIREAATLTSIFGATNSAGLTGGFGGISGADVIFVSNGSGGFNQYYYDDLEGSWADVNGAAVNGASVPIIYTDSLIVSATAPVNLVVSGEVKLTPTATVTSSGFNYISSVYPAGATLSSTFDAAIPQLDRGFGSIAGADVFFVANGTGGYNQYYYDDLETSWADVNGVAVNGASISLDSGVIFSNENTPLSLKLSAPSFYGDL
ncbi:hypothetical protein OKA04_03925 [Luteolibacter flavescens]|uniref:Uncharacterized protein n=1 Tax=Luteolibacter flavescens TaxID=1859460 RepID=A0ABT3FJZ0_9BACT|nr:hypothetical protein [Luteolibacter flavescens]MCW1883861.1 hypothetical protein [Luteolibacter flavescens]